MPRRTVNKKNKQKMITSRLMQFNLKLDDYIYKKTPISDKKAKLYMKEIISYREDCIHDERTLQVIEKLTRCMKGIIAEQHEMGISTNTDDNQPMDEQGLLNPRSNNTSPVYSLPDADKTYNSECRTSKVENRILDNEIPVTDLCTDLNQDEAELRRKSLMISVNIDIERAISDLSLKTTDVISVSNALLEKDSQNIPDINENFDKSSKLTNTVIINNKPMVENSLTQNNSDEINSKNKTFMDIVTEHNLEDSNIKIPVISSGNNTLNSNANISKTKVKDKIGRQQKSKENKQKNTLINRKRQTKNTVNNENASTSTVKNKVKRLNKDLNDIQANNVTKTPNKTDAPKFKQITEDLSWLDKITHVRIVTTSECDSKLAISEESFWENCTLPGDWTDEQFLYTI